MQVAVGVQQNFFGQLRNHLPPHISLVEELVNVLNVSHDSVYRRIRGDKPISLEEIYRICTHFKVSFDALMQLSSDAIVFFKPETQDSLGGLRGYLNDIFRQMKYFNSFEKRQMYYLCKDAPLFHFYLFPEIAAFKTFFWTKSVLNDPDYAVEKFSLEKHNAEDCFILGQDIIREYNKISSVELWNYESLNSTISQLMYYRDAQMFASSQDLIAVVHSLLKVIEHLQAQAVSGCKQLGDKKPPTRIEFYVNEIIIGSNSILLELDGSRMSIFTYSVLKYLATRDDRICSETFSSFENLKNRSILISQSGERERNKFFHTLMEKTSALLDS